MTGFALTAQRVTELCDATNIAVVWYEVPATDTLAPLDREVVVHGVRTTFAFDRARLDPFRDEIIAMLAQLPDEFRRSSLAGGSSFLNACMTSAGEQWGEHADVEMLLALGQAIGRVQCLVPQRALWKDLPGGMPYYAVLDLA